jgi:hypothetical protein
VALPVAGLAAPAAPVAREEVTDTADDDGKVEDDNEFIGNAAWAPGGGGPDSDGMRTDISMGASSSLVDCSDAGCDSDTDSEEEDDETENAEEKEEEEEEDDDDEAAAATAKHRATGDTHACIESRSISRSTTGCTHEAKSPASNCEGRIYDKDERENSDIETLVFCYS